jgi:hypothetical protein
MTDDGYTISELMMSGYDVSTREGREHLYSVLNDSCITLCDGALYIEADERTFTDRMHDLISVMQAINSPQQGD